MAPTTRTCRACLREHSDLGEPMCETCAAGGVSNRGQENLDFPHEDENAYEVEMSFEWGAAGAPHREVSSYFLYAESHDLAATYAGMSLTWDYYWLKRRARPLAAIATRKSDGETQSFEAIYEGREYRWERRP